MDYYFFKPILFNSGILKILPIIHSSITHYVLNFYLPYYSQLTVYCLTPSAGAIPLWVSNYMTSSSFQTYAGGGFCLIFRFLAKSDGVGERSLLRRETAESELDFTTSLLIISLGSASDSDSEFTMLIGSSAMC